MTGPAELPRHEGPSRGSRGRSVPPARTRRETCPARQALCRPLLGPLWSPSLTDREGTGRSIPTLPVLGIVRVSHGSDLQVPLAPPPAAPWSRDLPPPAPPVTALAPSRRKAEGPGREDENATSDVPLTMTERSFGPCRLSAPRARAHTPRKVHHVTCARRPTRRLGRGALNRPRLMRSLWGPVVPSIPSGSDGSWRAGSVDRPRPVARHQSP